jgi:Mg2+/Co2+ transporter CorC
MQLWIKQTFTKVDSTNVLQTENSFMQWTLLALYSKFKITSHDKNNVVQVLKYKDTM